MFKISSLEDFDQNLRKEVLEQLKEIFFLSSSTTEFETDKQKDNFFLKWAGIYFNKWPKWSLVYEDEQGILLGYVCGHYDSESFLKKNPVPTMDVFKDLFLKYPAHLHINCHPLARGQGVGSKLISAYFDKLQRENIRGCHIITSDSSRNITFYKRNSFNFTEKKQYQNSQLLLMGRSVSSTDVS